METDFTAEPLLSRHSNSGEAHLSVHEPNSFDPDGLGIDEVDPMDEPSCCARIDAWFILNQRTIIRVLAAVSTILLIVALGCAFTLAYAPLTVVLATVLTAVLITANVLAVIALVALLALAIYKCYNYCYWSSRSSIETISKEY